MKDQLVVRWSATYISDKLDPPVEVRLQSTAKPRKHRVFRIAGGRGRAKFTAQEIHRITTTTKENTMARAKKNTTVDDELEELEAALDDDDLEDLELDDEDDDEDEEVEEVKPKRSRSKKAAATKTKAERAKERRAARKAAEEDDEEEEDEKPRKRSKKTTTKTKSGKAKKAAQPPALVRELPAGKLGAAEIADLAGTDARAVRVFLRKNADKFPRNEELGRYAFTKKQAQQIAKAVKAS